MALLNGQPNDRQEQDPDSQPPGDHDQSEVHSLPSSVIHQVMTLIGDWWYGPPSESDYLLVLGSIYQDIELCRTFGRDCSQSLIKATNLCHKLRRWYLLDELPTFDWTGPVGPMLVTYQRQRIIDQYGITYQYPDMVLTYPSWWNLFSSQ